ncbi:UspA domain-containing protein [Candidatus Nitrosopumilus koreensis AR1]|uniref:UspA domain-containing protein n=1 Tax=Candidatus Nitrosopumilus koreensis AR1 TaxID=1229908 RepID=K0BA11_9ARCH|nr:MULTISPECIES: universal stress protein [Nitrosopumilus]AFS81291.1 UspA domain-containing protein [Candidatus Nitrosopumilus koreensis AR1]
MYKTILVPHGGTPAGDESLRHAMHLAKTDSAKIIVLHVVESIPIPPSFALSQSEREKLVNNIDDANKTIKQSMEKVLADKIEELGTETIIEVKVVEGDAAEEILRIVLERDVDLIVMAKRRKLKGLKKLLSLGSVSRKIVEHVTCPVYLIDIGDI